MSRFRITFALSTLLLVSICSGQQTSTTAVPNLIRYAGTLKDAPGTAISSATVGVTFAIYKRQEGGAPVWQETQNVITDANGNYSVLLGSTTATGLPSDLFSQQEQRWLGVQVQGEAEQARVLLVSVPYAIKADEADKLSGHSASEFVTTDNLQGAVKEQLQQQAAVVAAAGQALAPAGAYIDNGTTLQVGANFNIDGSGSAAIFNATSHYNLGGRPVLGNNGTQSLFLGAGAGQNNSGSYNTFLGLGAGLSNTTASSNTFAGYNAGRNNTTGNSDVFIGMQAGYHNTTGGANTFLGYAAGSNNTTGRANFFLGYAAGLNNTTGSQNSFLGVNTGLANTTGHDNSFLGLNAGWANTTGSDNIFIGNSVGSANASGSGNVFVGMNAGQPVVTGNKNTFLGYNAGSSAGATASNDVYIANQGVASDNGVMRIGDPANQTAAYVAGIYGSTTSSGSAVFVDATGKMGTAGGSVLTVPNGGSGATSFAAYAPVVGGTSTTGALQSTAVGRARQVFVSGGSGTVPAYIDFPDTKIIPAANCIAGTAGAGWSNAASNFTAACRAGSSNLGGALQAIPVTGAVAQFMLELPADWDTATQPYISIYYGSGANSSGTVIWTVSSACSQMNGSTTDDPAFVAEPAFAPQTMAAASRTWAKNGQFTRMTGSNNCVAGSSVIIKVAVTGTAASAINAYQAVVTIPRLLTVQAN